jgi:glucose/arabinose dehydrogenase
VIPLALLLASAATGQGFPGVDEYQEHCAVCHGNNLEGAALGVPLLGELRHGDSNLEIIASISNGFAPSGMPAWRDTLSTSDIRNLALLIAESRANITYETFNYNAPLAMPEGVLSGELHSFRLETVAIDLDAQPFSIEPMPDGSILLTEKKFGMRIISPTGEKSELIQGTPQAYADTFVRTLEQEWGWGWMFDVALHPDYENNRWIYLYYGDRCSDCNAMSRESGAPVSMNKLVRGKLQDGNWVEQETIWQADIEHYGAATDIGAGGRIAFDNAGHVFLSVGIKGGYFQGIQDLSTPWGKIHRVNDDGSIPEDNPFADRNDVYRSIYTYGHRSPQGLEFDLQNGELWGTEHGPRGGDELNRLLPGRNYGWPLYSLGMDYDGTPVEYGKDLGIEFDLSDIEQPVVDLTPSPAVSSFIISTSEQFPQWRGDFLVGSLKARSLFRFDIENSQLVGRETLLEGLARIRDIATGFDDEIYLLLEHNSGSRIVRLVPGS